MTGSDRNVPFEHLRALAECAGAAVIYLGPDMELNLANAPALERFGCASETELAARWTEGLSDRIRKLIPTNPTGDCPVELPASAAGEAIDGGTIQIRLRPLGEGLRRAWLGLVGRSETDEELEGIRYLATRMQSLSRVGRSLAHDLRSPLNSVVLVLELLAQSLARESVTEADRERQREQVGTIRREIGRFTRQLEDVLRQTRSDPSRSRIRLDLLEVVTVVERLVAPLARRSSIALRVEVPSGVRPRVIGVPERIEQAVLSVVVHALDALPAGGSLRLEVLPHDGHVTIAVESRPAEAPASPGPPGAARSRSAADPTPALAWLGLEAARSVAEAHGGRLRAWPLPPSGERVELNLPRAPGDTT